MRAFLGVPVAPPALDALAALLDEMRAALPSVRWVRPDGLHVTLHFWASLQDDAVARAVDVARPPALRSAAYEAQLGGLGAFPRDGDERVLWLGMRDGEQQTGALREAVESALATAGFPREERRFHPHVTLGRPRLRLDGDARRRWQGFAGVALPPFPVEAVHLYRSHPGPGGSHYELLATLPLSAAA